MNEIFSIHELIQFSLWRILTWFAINKNKFLLTLDSFEICYNIHFFNVIEDNYSNSFWEPVTRFINPYFNRFVVLFKSHIQGVFNLTFIVKYLEMLNSQNFRHCQCQDIWNFFDIDNDTDSWNKRTVMSDYHVMFDTFFTQFFYHKI